MLDCPAPRRTVPRSTWALFALIALLAVAMCVGFGYGVVWVVEDWNRPESERLIDRLAHPQNKVRVVGHSVPGGEWLSSSEPMDRLIVLCDEARPYLHRRLADETVQNEVALALGDVGDEATVPLLIDAYPTADVSGELGCSSLDARAC